MSSSVSKGDLGTIIFSHANSYPGSTYRVLLEAWQAAGYKVHALPMFGHNPQWPVTNQWPHLTSELEAFVRSKSPEPAYLVGHSLGGYVNLSLALHSPALVRGLVLLDSPILTGWRAQLLRTVKAAGLIRRVSPAKVAIKRRHQWASTDEAKKHFGSKALFSAWDSRVLQDYIDTGLHRVGAAQQLRFRPDVEATIYDTLPDRLGAQLRRRSLHCPVAFVGGRNSEEIRVVGLDATRRLVGERITWIEGSHLFPFEKPDETAKLVVDHLKAFASAA